MSTIVPPTTPTQHRDPRFDRTAAMSRCDGCPECVLNVDPPRDVADGDGCYYAGYLCVDCGHAWITTWGAA